MCGNLYMRCENEAACENPKREQVPDSDGQFHMIFLKHQICIFAARGQPGCPGTREIAPPEKAFRKCKHCLEKEIDEREKEWERIAQEQQNLNQERERAKQARARLEEEKRALDERVASWLEQVANPNSAHDSFPATISSMPASSLNVTGNMPAPTTQTSTGITTSNLPRGATGGYGAMVPPARGERAVASSGGALSAAQAPKRERSSDSANSRPSSRASNLSSRSGGSGASVKIGESALSGGGTGSKPPSSKGKGTAAPAAKKKKFDQ